MTKSAKTKPALVPEFYDLMPFIGKNSNGRRNFWSVEQPADYGVACALGEGYARLAFRLSQNSPVGPANFIRQIILDMAKGADTHGVEVGFLGEVARLAMAGYQTVPVSVR